MQLRYSIGYCHCIIVLSIVISLYIDMSMGLIHHHRQTSSLLLRYQLFKGSRGSRFFCKSVETNNDDTNDDTNISKSIRPPILQTTQWSISPVGIIVSPYDNGKHNVPKQATISRLGQVQGHIKLFPDFKECLLGLADFDYIWAISWMHLNEGYKTKIRPQPRKELITSDKKKQVPNEVGLFASRSPHRPNQIALSALKVTNVDIENGLIYIDGLDLLDGTPILDIKPYIPAFDSFHDARAGWMDLLIDDMYEARKNGYQQIHSPRGCLLYTSPSPRDRTRSRMPSSA